MSVIKRLRTSKAATVLKRAVLRPLISRQLQPPPLSPRGTVVFAGLTQQKLHVCGKMSPARFLPAICNVLRSEGYHTFFACSEAELASFQNCSRPLVVVMLYGEDDTNGVPESESLWELLKVADVVFNHPRVGSIIRSKRRTHQFLTAAGVQMPGLKELADTAIFSNADASSGASIKLLEAGAQLDCERYNTEFIDTRRLVNGKEYYATVRLMCVGSYVTHAFVRARDVSEGDPSVHLKDTPHDAELINTLERQLIEPNKVQFSELAQRTYDALGPGFYAHDILVEAGSNRVLMCETGFKFNDASFAEWVEAVRSQRPTWNPLHTAEQAAIAAVKPFLDTVSSNTSLKTRQTRGLSRESVTMVTDS